MIHEMSRRPGSAALLLGCAASGIYLFMITVTLPRIEAMSGLRPFDMRPSGYSSLEAAQILEALGPDGRVYYLSHQIPLDTVYPGLLMLTLIATIGWLQARVPFPKLAFAGTAFAVAAAIADYSENLGIVLMILGWPDLSDLLVRVTSLASILKAVSTTASVLVVIVLAAIRMSQLVARPGSRSL